MDLEQQLASGRVEARSVAFTDVDVSQDGKTFSGYAAVFGQEADLGEYTESISRGAFRKAIGSSGNVPMLWDHNPTLPPFATTRAGTLRLKEDGKGLRVDAQIDPRHMLGPTLASMMERGDVRGMSFGFVAGKGNSLLEHRSGVKPHRNLIGFKRLLDVSPTWNEAYPETSVELRSLRALQAATDETAAPGDTLAERVEKVAREFRALTTGELQNTLGGLQSTAEAIEAALNQVGIGEPDESDEIAPGPFTDEQYVTALEAIQQLIEGAEGLLENAGFPDPDEAEDATEDDVMTRSADSGAQTAEAAAAARKRRLHMMGLTLPAELR